MNSILRLAALLGFALIASALLTSRLRQRSASEAQGLAETFPLDIGPAPKGLPSDDGLIVAFLTSSQCAAARDAELPRLVDAALLTVERGARKAGLGFSSVAIAIDRNPLTGSRELARYAQFQEWASGGGRRGLAFSTLFRGANAGADATPGVVIGRWTLEGDPTRGRRIEVLKRYIGVGEIKQWARDADNRVLALLRDIETTPRATVGAAAPRSP
jgi:hypothetical protein